MASIILAIIAVGISLGAGVIAFIALWKTHLTGFSPIVITGNLRHHIYPVTKKERKWYICSFDIPISITNGGAKPGNILGLRLSLSFPELQLPGNRELFPPVFEIDPRDYAKLTHDRFKLKEIVIGGWMPYTVLPKQSVIKHLLFESRWDEPVIQERILCSLELYTDRSPKWKEVAKWEISLTADKWDFLEKGNSWFYQPLGSPKLEEPLRPTDLHKYTREAS
ncbi:MAG: hypothetical protein ACFFCW_41125 [Candidatus Hodarchaeota archaeon]